jgi:ribonuclease HI
MVVTIHCDGSCYHLDGRMGVGAVFFKDEEDHPYKVRAQSYRHKGTNNTAEYLAIILALKNIECSDGLDIRVKSDSEIVINQINSVFMTRDEVLIEYYKRIEAWVMMHPEMVITFSWVPRTDPHQKIVDKLSKKANPYFNKK